MPTLHLELDAQVSPDDLVSAAGQLSLPEMDQLVKRLIAMRAKRLAPSLPADESKLLAAINQGLPASLRARFDTLIERRRAGTLTPDERDELLRLTDEVEAAEAERVSNIASLARLRGVLLDELLVSLGIQTPEYG